MNSIVKLKRTIQKNNTMEISVLLSELVPNIADCVGNIKVEVFEFNNIKSMRLDGVLLDQINI